MKLESSTNQSRSWETETMFETCKNHLASLGWMEVEGYAPISLRVLNNATKQIEEISLGNVEDLLGTSSEI